MLDQQRERLRVLADSVNETARMARATNSVFLVAVLYLTLTLLSTSDENLLLNGQVILPQIGTGISVVDSYVFAPLVFLFLHGQVLFLLVVLARKVRTFEAALRDEFPDTAFDTWAKRRECRDWLSAFALVQAFRKDTGLSTISMVLTWLTAGAIPLALLFAIDLSFVRYQSEGITQIHHVIFIVDLALVILFNWRVFGGESSARWGRLGTWIQKVLVSGMLIFLFFAHPPNGNEQPSLIWSHDGQSGMAQSFVFNLIESGNLLDAGPCKWWGMACRYLDVSHLETGPHLANDDDQGRNLRGSVTKIDLSGRNLRFVRFPHAQLEGVNLRYAKLQKADFQDAQLKSVDFQGAQLQGAILERAQLQGAILERAQLQEAKLSRAQLQDAELSFANLNEATLFFVQLQGANLRKTKLKRARLHRARLQGATLDGAQLQEAHLLYAQLQGADLSSANLNGANLSEAQLQGAKLDEALLRGANLTGVRLEGVSFHGAALGGANLRDASLLCSHGKPADWQLAWMPGTSYELSRLGVSKSEGEPDESIEQLLNELIADDIGNIRIPHETHTIWDHLRVQLKNCQDRPFSGTRPRKSDLVVHSGNPIDAFRDWPSSATTNEAYWRAWGDWAVEFACEGEYNAHSSLRRWRNIEDRFGERVPNIAANIVRMALVSARTNADDCPGLSAIPEDDLK